MALGGGGGHHHHHGHRRGGGWGGPMFYPLPYQSPYPSEVFLVSDGDDEKDKRIMAYIATLPKNARAAAYEKFFGKAAPAGMFAGLGSFSELAKGPWLWIGAAVIAAHFFWKKR